MGSTISQFQAVDIQRPFKIGENHVSCMEKKQKMARNSDNLEPFYPNNLTFGHISAFVTPNLSYLFRFWKTLAYFGQKMPIFSQKYKIEKIGLERFCLYRLLSENVRFTSIFDLQGFMT